MNIQELIEKYKKYEDGLFDIGAKVACQNFLKDLEQLDEPQKVKVPQFVADWIEDSKKTCKTVAEFFSYKFQNIEMTKYFQEKERIDLVARAWLDGYEVEEEVEKEKEYKVVLLNYNDGHLNLVNVRTLGENIIFFTKKTQFDPRSLKLTKAEIISSGFGWVFDCPGIQIEEVE